MFMRREWGADAVIGESEAGAERAGGGSATRLDGARPWGGVKVPAPAARLGAVAATLGGLYRGRSPSLCAPVGAAHDFDTAPRPRAAAYRAPPMAL
jgi:hypothetical protein